VAASGQANAVRPGSAAGTVRRLLRGHPVAAGCLAVVVAGVIYLSGVARARAGVPTATVVRTEFVDVMELRSDIRPVRSVVLGAPTQSGDLQVIRLVKNGSAVKAGDVVVEFDGTALRRQETDRRAELRQADAEIEQSRAQQRIVEEATATNLMRAKFDVERAKIDSVDRGFLAQLDVERAKLGLVDAEQRLVEAQKRQVAELAAAAATVAGRVRRRDRVQQDLNRIERAIANLIVKAPSGGTASLMPNPRSGSASGGNQDFREGDRAWPGASIVELPDLSSVHLTARLDESDRGRVEVDQAATVHLDAVPDKVYHSKVSRISLLARVDFASTWPPARDFDLELVMADPDARLKPGMTASVRIAVARFPGALVVPAKAVSLVNGRPTVYVQNGSDFEPRAVVMKRRGREQVALASGVEPGERVALENPAAKGRRDR
jgi:HlyD family secretion protein